MKNWFAAAAISMVAIAPAAAQSLTLDGAWGNDAGCKFAKEGRSEDDSFVVLKADELQSYGTGCEWVQVLTAKSGAQAAVGICGYEGQDGLGSNTFVIKRDEADKNLIRIYAENGEPWAEVRKCP